MLELLYAFYFSKIYTHDLTFSTNEVENVEDIKIRIHT